VPAPPALMTVVISERVERTTEIANAALIQARCSSNRSRENSSDLKYTIREPIVSPSIAVLMAKKARW